MKYSVNELENVLYLYSPEIHKIFLQIKEELETEANLVISYLERELERVRYEAYQEAREEITLEILKEERTRIKNLLGDLLDRIESD